MNPFEQSAIVHPITIQNMIFFRWTTPLIYGWELYAGPFKGHQPSEGQHVALLLYDLHLGMNKYLSEKIAKSFEENETPQFVKRTNFSLLLA